MIKKFASYYKPHIKLFVLDIVCAFLFAGCSLFYPMVAQKMINVYIPNKNLSAILWASSIILFVYVIKMILNYIIQYWGHVVGARMQADMRKELFVHLEKLPFSYYDENKTGTIMSRLVNDLFEIAELAHHGPEDLFISTVTLIGAIILIICNINPWLALILFLGVPAIALFTFIRYKKMRNAFRQMRVVTGEINAQIESSITGIRISKSYTAIEHEVASFEKKNKDYMNARTHAFLQMSIFNSGSSFFMDVLYVIALLAGGLFFYFEKIDSGQLTAYILCTTMIINPIFTLATIFEQIQNGMTGFKRFIDILDIPVEFENENALILENVKDNISFENVSFSYEKDEENNKTHLIFKNFNLEIKEGKTVALVGPSGQGKTTLCHLLPRFYDVIDGEIKIDGVNIKDYTLTSLRKCISLVSQDVFLFDGTIKENIAYGDFNASDDKIIEAAKKANIHDYIMSLEKGYDTLVGERGVKLSGGQKQRISIARAFLKDAPILILDEATSALDNATEMLVQDALESLASGRTTIVVAHRLSTVKNADEIIVITENGIQERGTHEHLIEKNGVYAQLYQYQFKNL